MGSRNLLEERRSCPLTRPVGRGASTAIDGVGMHQFRIDVQDLGEPGVGNDTYRILLDTGYDSGVQELQGGNVQIR